MRDPARINRLLSLLSAYWHAHPDLRLAQIVGNLMPREWPTGNQGDPYDVIEQALRQALAKPTERTP